MFVDRYLGQLEKHQQNCLEKKKQERQKLKLEINSDKNSKFVNAF